MTPYNPIEQLSCRHSNVLLFNLAVIRANQSGAMTLTIAAAAVMPTGNLKAMLRIGELFHGTDIRLPMKNTTRDVVISNLHGMSNATLRCDMVMVVIAAKA